MERTNDHQVPFSPVITLFTFHRHEFSILREVMLYVGGEGIQGRRRFRRSTAAQQNRLSFQCNIKVFSVEVYLRGQVDRESLTGKAMLTSSDLK